MTAPQRIQMRRTKGWRKPNGAIYVGRPTRWGNPYRAGDDLQRGFAVALFSYRLRRTLAEPSWDPVFAPVFQRMADHLEELRGHDLACWCPLDAPCHADVLLELANR